MNWTTRADRSDVAHDCPTVGAWQAFLETDDSAGLGSLDAHLDVCPRCQERLSELTSRAEWESELRAFQSYVPTSTLPETAVAVLGEPVSACDRNGQTPFCGSRFRDLKPIGRGGCGMVYRAEDTVLGRTVALKIPHAAFLAEQEASSRFVTELRVAAVLQHPNIVVLFDAGVSEQTAFIIFEYVPGPTLAAWLAAHAGPVDCRIAAAIVSRLAAGVSHAHECHVLHRDLKPSNVLLDERRSSGQLPFVPRITDFGIARFLNSDVTHTIDERVVGSPPFMSPEQAAGDRSRIGPPSDVYALGAILYQLLTKTLPIQGSNVPDTLRRIMVDEPVPPQRRRADVPRDLEAICLKCLSKDPRERYASARDLELDLERFLASEPVIARPPGVWDSARRFVRRYPSWTLLMGTVFLAVLTVVVLLSRHNAALGHLAGQLGDANAQLRTTNTDLQTALGQAKHSRDTARANEHRVREALYAYDLRQAFRAAEENDARMLRSILERYADGTELVPYRGVEWEYLWTRAHREQRPILQVDNPVYKVAFSKDGRLLAAGGKDAVVRLLEWPSGKPRAHWPSGQVEVNGLCFAPDGQRLWTAGDDGTLCEWDTQTAQRLQRFDAHAPHLAFEVLYDEPRQRLITCGREATIRLWEANSGQPAGVLEGHTGTVDSIHILPDQARLVSQTNDLTLRIWNLESLKQERSFPCEHPATFVTASPDGRWLAACLKENFLLAIDLVQDRTAQWHSGNEPYCLCFDDTSRRLFVGDMLGVIAEWQPPGSDGEEWSLARSSWQAHQDRVFHLNWSPQTQELISAGSDGRVLAWKDQATLLQQELTYPGVDEVVFVPQGRQVLVAGKGGLFLSRYKTSSAESSSPENTQVLSTNPDWARLAVSAEGDFLAAGSKAGQVGVWRRGDEQPLFVVPAFTDTGVYSLTFTPDGRHVCAMCLRGTAVQVIELATGKVAPSTTFPRAQHMTFAPAPDGRVFATAFERTTQVIDVQTRRVLSEMPSSSLVGRPMQFFNDGTRLALVHERKVCVHDTATGRRLQEFLGHPGHIDCVAVCSDGRTMATSSRTDQTVKLWHIATGQHLADFPIAWGGASRCAFTLGDDWLLIRMNDTTIRLLKLGAD